MSCHMVPQPLNYARHSLRALTLWLLSLPFALMKDLRLLTGPALFLVSWLLFGVYEIGYAIEDPFQGTLRLSIICDIIRRDVLGDELIRRTAFDLEESKNEEDEEGNDELVYMETPGKDNIEIDHGSDVSTSDSNDDVLLPKAFE
jgi:predicted membrane chloride channel (bestrophin family)